MTIGNQTTLCTFFSKFIAVACVMVLSIFFSDCAENNLAPSEPIVYVAGNDEARVKYWKDGLEVPLETTEGATFFNANCIAVSGDDVYVVGIDNGLSTFWKNGKRTPLGIIHHDTEYLYNSVAVSGNDVYVAGSQSDVGQYPVAMYWRNGEAVMLNDGFAANAIAASGNDVYVLGYAREQIVDGNGTSKVILKYWKNGVSTTLTGQTKPATASSIAVSGNDVYVGGKILIFNDDRTQIEFWDPVYWKNGTMVLLEEPEFYHISGSSRVSIAVSGTDVYLVTEGTVYWKNGEFNYVPGSFPTSSAYATSLAVAGSDLYLAGHEWILDPTNGWEDEIKYWKNGNPVILAKHSNSPKAATSIFVAQ